jgi:hypothetical protein
MTTRAQVFQLGSKKSTAAGRGILSMLCRVFAANPPTGDGCEFLVAALDPGGGGGPKPSQCTSSRGGVILARFKTSTSAAAGASAGILQIALVSVTRSGAGKLGLIELCAAVREGLGIMRAFPARYKHKLLVVVETQGGVAAKDVLEALKFLPEVHLAMSDGRSAMHGNMKMVAVRCLASALRAKKIGIARGNGVGTTLATNVLAEEMKSYSEYKLGGQFPSFAGAQHEDVFDALIHATTAALSVRADLGPIERDVAPTAPAAKRKHFDEEFAALRKSKSESEESVAVTELVRAIGENYGFAAATVEEELGVANQKISDLEDTVATQAREKIADQEKIATQAALIAVLQAREKKNENMRKKKR